MIEGLKKIFHLDNTSPILFYLTIVGSVIGIILLIIKTLKEFFEALDKLKDSKTLIALYSVRQKIFFIGKYVLILLFFLITYATMSKNEEKDKALLIIIFLLYLLFFVFNDVIFYLKRYIKYSLEISNNLNNKTSNGFVNVSNKFNKLIDILENKCETEEEKKLINELKFKNIELKPLKKIEPPKMF